MSPLNLELTRKCPSSEWKLFSPFNECPSMKWQTFKKLLQSKATIFWDGLRMWIWIICPFGLQLNQRSIKWPNAFVMKKTSNFSLFDWNWKSISRFAECILALNRHYLNVNMKMQIYFVFIQKYWCLSARKWFVITMEYTWNRSYCRINQQIFTQTFSTHNEYESCDPVDCLRSCFVLFCFNWICQIHLQNAKFVPL